MARALLLTAAALPLLALAACGDDGGSASAIDVTSTKDACTSSVPSVPAGRVVVNVENDGNDVTEVYVLQGEKIMGEVENVGPGQRRPLRVSLDAGDYTITCKPGMKGDGISTPLAVTGTAAGDADGDADGEAAAGTDVQLCADVATADGQPLAVTLKDFNFTVTPGDPPLQAGKVTVTATNEGQHEHEIVFVRAPRSELQLNDDGTVDEDALPEGAVVAELEAFDPGKTCTNTFTLPAGAYTLLCNVAPSGDVTQGHAGLGMTAELVIEPAAG